MRGPKTIILNYSSLLVYATLIHFSTWLWIANGIIYNNHDGQLHGWTKKLQSNAQSQSALKGYGPIQLSESWKKNPYNWDVCSANQWYAPDCTSNNQYFQSWTNWAMKFNLILHIHPTFHSPTITSSSISTTFCRKHTSTASRIQKILSKCLSNQGV